MFTLVFCLVYSLSSYYCCRVARDFPLGIINFLLRLPHFKRSFTSCYITIPCHNPPCLANRIVVSFFSVAPVILSFFFFVALHPPLFFRFFISTIVDSPSSWLEVTLEFCTHAHGYETCDSLKGKFGF